jgi:hypothetical protein
MVAGAPMHELAAKVLFDRAAVDLPRIAVNRGWSLNEAAFPMVDVTFQAKGRTPLRLRLACRHFNEQPPGIDLLRSDGSFLPVNSSNPGGNTGVFNMSAHPATGRPFVCMRGSREYHVHPNHARDSWAPLAANDNYTLLGILYQLWNAWLKGAG